MKSIKRLLLTSSAIALVGGPALAADITVVEYVPPPAQPVFDWAGPYVGVHGGFGGDRFDYPWSFSPLEDDRSDIPSAALLVANPDGPNLDEILEGIRRDGLSGSFDITSSGFFGGGQAGYNWQVSPNFLVGVEADIAWSGIKGELGAGVDSWGSLDAGTRVNWFGTVRGRVGVVNGPLLVYGTGGFAYGDVESYVNFDPGDEYSTSQSSHGWTAGGGVEFMVAPNVSVKTEYLYVDLGSQDLLAGFSDGNLEDAGLLSADLRSETQFHTIKAGINVHLGEPNSEFAMPVPPTYDWNGFYVGVHGGYGGNKFDYPWSIDSDWQGMAAWLRGAAKEPPDGFDTEDLLFLAGKVSTFDGPFTGSFDITSSGFFGGTQGGFNWQPAPSWLVGVEADIAASGIKGELGVDLGPLANARAGSQVNWFGTVRGRAGWITGPLLIYGTGGFAYGDVKSYADISLFDGWLEWSESTSETATGWTAGGGFEYMINPNLSFKTEYLYVDLGTQNLYNRTYTDEMELPEGMPDIMVNLDQNTTFHTVKAGLNLHF